MRAAWIIAVREVREKARLFVICAALAFVPFAATLLPGTQGNAEATIAVVGGFLATILGLGIAATLGASMIVRDLAERRMSFYFTKPVSATAIWVGKASSSLFISLACTAIIGVPAYLASKNEWAMRWLGDVRPLYGLAIAIAALFFLAHAMSSVIRSRSPLLALDFVFLIAAVAGVYLILHPLIVGGAVALAGWMQIGIGTAVLLILATAPVWQLANGRSDIRRSHAALMRFLWPGIAVMLLVAGGLVAWVTNVEPEDIEVMFIEQPSRGSFVIVSGRAKNRFDYHATFLVDRATGRATRLAAAGWWGAQFSADGRVAAWLQLARVFATPRVELHTTKGPTGLALPAGADFALSADGTRVAFTNGPLLAVHDVATGRLLASGSGLQGRGRQQPFFVSGDVVRLVEQDLRGASTTVRVFELDVRERSMRKTAEWIGDAPRHAVSVSHDGARMFIRGANVLVDMRTGEVLASLRTPNAAHAAMLHDGRIAVVTREGNVPHLRTFRPDGTPQHDVAFPGVQSIWIAGETEGGKLLLAAYGKTMVVVDLNRGLVERSLPGIRGPLPEFWGDPRLPLYAADQELVGIDAKGKLVSWSPRQPTPRPLWTAAATPPLSNARRER